MALDEDRETSDQGDYSSTDKAKPRRIWLERTFPRKGISAHALSFHRGIKAYVAEGERGPCYQSCDGTKTLEPTESLRRTSFGKTC